jgi:hypothetical protein
MALDFEWDASKARANARKHGVTFAEGLSVFRDPLARIFTADQRLLLVAYTERAGRIRLISARPATTREREDYEQDAT